MEKPGHGGTRILSTLKEEVNLKEVEAVTCADRKGEGYRSMMNIIG